MAQNIINKLLDAERKKYTTGTDRYLSKIKIKGNHVNCVLQDKYSKLFKPKKYFCFSKYNNHK